jgi:CRISPR-associated protein Csx17
VARAQRQLDAAIFDLCVSDSSSRVLDVLLALGECERALSSSSQWAREAGIPPVPPLSAEWLQRADDGSPELRLAAALASVYRSVGAEGDAALRSQLEPIRYQWRGPVWTASWDPDADRDVTWTSGDIVGSLSAALGRRLLRAEQLGAPTYPDVARVPAQLADVAAFVEGRVDDARLGELLWACVLLDWRARRPPTLPRLTSRDAKPTASYALLKLCFAGAPVNSSAIPLVPRIFQLARAGRGSDAIRAAIARLRACDLIPVVSSAEVSPATSRRIAAALLIPLGEPAIAKLANRVLRPGTTVDDNHLQGESYP